MVGSICFCIGQVLIELLMEQPSHAPACKCFLLLLVSSHDVYVDRMDPMVEQSLGSVSFSLCSFCVHVFPLDSNISGINFEMSMWPHGHYLCFLGYFC